MVDLLTKARRSRNMRQIQSKHTKPELAVRRIVHSMGYRFRLHKSGLPGRPDIVFQAPMKIIDVRGCFWHRHTGCIDSHIPKSRAAYWAPKLRGNEQRDLRNRRLLKKLGWKVLVIWECEVAPSKLSKLKRKIARFLGGT